jgi:WD40 repeat protein
LPKSGAARFAGVMSIVFFLIAIFAASRIPSLLKEINPTPTSQIKLTDTVQVISSPSSTLIVNETPSLIPDATAIIKRINSKDVELVPISIENANQVSILYSFNLGSDLIRWSISADGKNLVTGHKVAESVIRYYVRVWDMLNGNEVKSIRMPLILNDLYSKDGGAFITQCNKSTARVADEKSYDCTQGELFEIKMPNGELNSVSKFPGKVIGITNDYQMAIVNTCNEWIQQWYYLGPRVMSVIIPPQQNPK